MKEEKIEENDYPKHLKYLAEIPGVERTKKKSFSIDARHMFLTYARCPKHWNKIYLRDRLKELLVYKHEPRRGESKLISWRISEEMHQEENGENDRHYHCLLEGKEKFSIRNPKFLDIEEIHGNYQTVKDPLAVLKYITKEGNYISNNYPGLNEDQRDFLEAPTELAARLQRDTWNRSNPKYRLETREMYQEEKSIEMTLENTQKVTVKIPMFPFQRDLEPYFKQLKQFKDQWGFSIGDRGMGILLYGKSKSGKSSWLHHLERLLGERTKSFHNFGNMTGNYKGEKIILLDEMTKKTFLQYANEIKLMITDRNYCPQRFHVVKEFVSPRRIILATNEDVKDWIWLEGLRERFLVIYVTPEGNYQLKLWESNPDWYNMTDEQKRKNPNLEYVLKDKKLEDAMSALGFEVDRNNIETINIEKVSQEEKKFAE